MATIADILGNLIQQGANAQASGGSPMQTGADVGTAVGNAPAQSAVNPATSGAIGLLQGLVSGAVDPRATDPVYSEAYSKQRAQHAKDDADAAATGTVPQYMIDRTLKTRQAMLDAHDQHLQAAEMNEPDDSAATDSTSQQQAPPTPQFDPATLNQINANTAQYNKPNFFDWLAKSYGMETPAVQQANANAAIGPKVKENYMEGQLPLTTEQKQNLSAGGFTAQAGLIKDQITSLDAQKQSLQATFNTMAAHPYQAIINGTTLKSIHDKMDAVDARSAAARNSLLEMYGKHPNYKMPNSNVKVAVPSKKDAPKGAKGWDTAKGTWVY